MLITNATSRTMLRRLGGKCYQTPNGPLLAIFENGFLESGDTESRRPFLTCVTVDAEGVLADRKGTTVDIDGKVYRIRRHEPDGTGISTIPLES